ncbi:MAG TPA: hypothetical protein DDX54_05085 [Rhodospirillaceae bacterium]|jgi:FtsH-binding integral membrane protein|nr:Bax inhibitor-1/YccA family protein [Alphaproteobacteria bacterium]HBH26756.1 hypothetical protein [Rhodospirillaceae bacterium]
MNERPSVVVQRAGARVDAGLRAYMQNVYNAMAGGLVVTGLVALLVANSPAALSFIFGNPVVYWIVVLSPFAVIWFGFGQVHRMSPTAVAGMYFGLTALIGLSLSSIFIIYTGESLARVFFITAATFAGMSVYGYTTKRDLAQIGSFLVMGIWGIFVAFLVNIFFQSAMVHYIASGIGVLVFTGMTAWDTQRIKETYHASLGRETLSKMVFLGALHLYLDFINLFIMLLQFFGDRR